MALDDTNDSATPGSIYGLDVPWPPPGFGMPSAPIEQTPAPEQVAATEYGGLNANALQSVPVPAPLPPPPPPTSTMGPRGRNNLAEAGAPTGEETPAAAPSEVAPPDGAGLPGVPALAAVPTLPPPPSDAASSAVPAPEGVPPIADPQLAMFGVPSSPEQLAAYGQQDQDARHQAYLDAVDQAGGEAPRVEGTEGEETDREAKILAANPYELARRDQEDERAAADQARAERAKAAAADAKAQTQNLANVTAARQQAAAARQQAMVEAQKIAAVDPTRWMNKSTYNAVTGVIAAALGGLGQMQNGGRNLGLEQLNKNIDRDIEAQQNEQQQKRANIQLGLSNTAANLADAEANYVDQERYRAGVYQRAMDDIQTKMQDFAPRSSAVRQLAHTYQQIAAAQQISYDKIEQADFNNRIKAAETAGKYALDVANTRKANAEAAKLEGKNAGIGASGLSVVGVFKSLDDVPPKERDKAFRLPVKNGVPGGWSIASSADNAKDATHLVGMYNQIDHDLNEMQRLSVEREGAKSAGGSIWHAWQTNGEQHYRQLLTDAANTYGMMIHGRAPTSGVLEEVLKDMPELKSAWDRGDTTELINDFRNDIDNRTTLRLQDYGANTKITSDRVKPLEPPNANTLSAPLVEKAVKGGAGYLPFDVSNADKSYDALAQHYAQNPTLGGNEGLAKAFDDIDAAQHRNIAEISTDIAKLQAVKKRTPAQETELHNDRKALADRQEAVKALADARKRHADVMGEAAKAAKEARRQQQTDEANSPAHGRFGNF